MVKKINVSLRNQSFYLNYAKGCANSKEMKHFHLHQDYEIFYMLEGEKLFLINNQQIIVGKDQIMCIDKNMLHKTLVSDQRYQRIVLNFRDSFLAKEDHFLIKSLFKRGPLLLTVNNPSIFRMIFEQMFREYFLENQQRNRYLQLLLTQFLIECDRSPTQKYALKKAASSYQQSDNINAIISYINEHFDRNITLSLLAELFFLHEQSISKLFKQTIGYSFTDYLNAVRISNAKQLLTETPIKINHVMKKVGYANHVHFWRIFKRFTGLSPNEYRLQYSNNTVRLKEQI